MMLHKVKYKDRGKSRSPSTFTTNSGGNPHSARKTLHSKSTYFYRWGSRLNYVVPSMCGLALLVGGIVCINPLINHNLAHAGIDIGDSGDSTGSDIPSISIAFPTTGLPEGYNNGAEQTTTVTPGVVAYRSNYFDVTVKNPSWYAVSVRAAKGYTSELKNGEATIAGVGENVTPNNFKENTWGYALTKVDSSSTVVDDTALSYSTLPDENSTLIDLPGHVTSENISEHYKVSFASLFSGDVPSGHYTTKVYLSAVANPGGLTSIFGPGTMQGMGKDPQTCATAQEGTTAQLVDERDGKYYWVSKMKDGSCWMTQNLDFDIPSTLSNSTSDVTADSVSTGISGSTDLSSWGYSAEKPTFNAYHDPGDYIYTYAGHGWVNGGSCTEVSSFADSKCTPYFTEETPKSDMHYHVGNYYTYSAATVRSGDNLTGGNNAPQSICPKGWKLPVGITNSSNSFEKLLTPYGINKNLTSTPSYDQNVLYSAYGNPIYFVYGGLIFRNKIIVASGKGYYRSASRYDTSSSYKLLIDSSVNTGSTDYSNYGGMSVRCLLEPQKAD